jgi:hypothetical protein
MPSGFFSVTAACAKATGEEAIATVMKVSIEPDANDGKEDRRREGGRCEVRHDEKKNEWY